MTATSGDNDKLDKLRAEIDRIDTELQTLISERARCAQKVGEIKGLSSTAEFYRPEREAQVLRRVVERNAGPLRDEEIVRVFRELMSACLAQEEPLKIAFVGPEGTFTHAAVMKHFGHSVRAMTCATVDEVFQEVESGIADFGVAPVENSSEGTVSHTLDMFLTSPLRICGEVEMSIHQHLLGRVRNLREVKRVCAQAQSLAQCRGWLAEHLPDVDKVTVTSNAEAARRARDEQGTAAIGGDAAASAYGLDTLFLNIEDEGDNTTRFLVIGRKILPPSGDDKTSLLMSAAHAGGPGALVALLAPLSERGINMTRIESRPSRRRKWDYVFFIDIDGHAESGDIHEALDKVRANADLFRVLGAYPKAVF